MVQFFWRSSFGAYPKEVLELSSKGRSPEKLNHTHSLISKDAAD
jgi:hypothetical protein